MKTERNSNTKVWLLSSKKLCNRTLAGSPSFSGRLAIPDEPSDASRFQIENLEVLAITQVGKTIFVRTCLRPKSEGDRAENGSAGDR